MLHVSCTKNSNFTCMRVRMLVVFIWFGFCCLAQTKTIIVKTDKKINYKKLKVYEPQAYIPLSAFYDNEVGWQVEKINNKCFSFTCTTNYAMVLLKGNVGYEIQNIDSLKTDTVVLSHLKFTPFNYVDTLRATIVQYKADSTVKN